MPGTGGDPEDPDPQQGGGDGERGAGWSLGDFWGPLGGVLWVLGSPGGPQWVLGTDWGFWGFHPWGLGGEFGVLVGGRF